MMYDIAKTNNIRNAEFQFVYSTKYEDTCIIVSLLMMITYTRNFEESIDGYLTILTDCKMTRVPMTAN